MNSHLSLAKSEILRKDGWSETTKNKNKEYCFVLDVEGGKLAPTSVNNGWYLIRKKRAKLVAKYPMVIQLHKSVEDVDYKIRLGIDDGSLHVGVGLVQECKTKNKPIFKATIEHRKDVSKLMEQRRGYRRYKRNHKRYRQAKFDNRASSRREGRIAPSILQKRQTIIRFVNKISKWIDIASIHLEDVAIDIRALTDDKKLYSWQYQKSNRLDENMRKAVIIRDKYECMECRKSNCMLEVHHIVPRRLRGSNTLDNLITLCSKCHQKTEGKEEKFVDKYQKMINGKSLRLNFAQHVMQGKNWLQQHLSQYGTLLLTSGGDTANRRIDWSIEKAHSNDALVICGLEIHDTNIKDWVIKPIRKKTKAIHSETYGFKHRDIVQYTDTKKVTHVGYITAMYTDKLQINIQTKEKHLKRVNVRKSVLKWRFRGLYFL